MAKSTKPFILNDEDVENSYGFYVSTEGIQLGRFEKNPVMLSDHQNSNRSVLGRWADWKKEGGKFLAYPDFDSDDPEAALIEGKVERDFIKGASMGLLFDYEDMVFIGGKVLLRQSELVEGTIIPVPSNSNALKLYLKGKEDTPLTEAELKSICLSLNPETTPEINPINNMKKIILGFKALMALGYTDAPKDGIEESEIESKVLELSAKTEAAEKKAAELEAENTQLKDAAKTAELSAKTTMVDEGITAGKIPATQRETYLAMDATVLKDILERIPAKQNLAAGIAPTGTTGNTDVKTQDDFLKLDPTAQLSFKQANPEAFSKLFPTR